MLDLTRPELAINGGPRVREIGWKDNFTNDGSEKEAVLRVLETGYLSKFEGSFTPDPPFSFYGGPEVQGLEAEWCAYYGCKYAISVNSATSGLFAAVGALGLGYGDEVIVSPYTMSACAIAPLIYGAIPVFSDVEESTGCMDPISIQERITDRTRAILVVHQFGIPANMDAIMALAKDNNLKVIEDCAQAHGAKYLDEWVGSIGDIGVFSLNVNKSIQTGEGGVCVTQDEDIAYRLALIRNHGEAVVGPAEYSDTTNIAGFNYRLTELQAAIGREQLKKLDKLNTHRIELVSRLAEQVSRIPFLSPMAGRDGCVSTFYVFPMRYFENRAGVSREAFVKAVNAEGGSLAQGYVRPLYTQPVYQKRHLFKGGYPFSAPENQESSVSYEQGLCPVTERLYSKEMILDEHIRYPHVAADIDDLIQMINKVCNVLC